MGSGGCVTAHIEERNPKKRSPGPCGTGASTEGTVPGFRPYRWLQRMMSIMCCFEVLLNGFAMQSDIEAFAFDFICDPQADDGVDDLEDDQRDDGVIQ